jgi:enoyl-CoA hydratase
MRFGDVSYEKKDRVAILTLDDQKKLNALSPGIRQGLKEGFAEVERDADIKAAIVTGAGRAFCAGADITGFNFDPVSVKIFLNDVFQALTIGEHVSKPVIAAVNGLALGGGLELAISCDMIIASEKAKFGVPEINLGLLPGFAIVRLHQIIGRSKSIMDEAMELAGKIASKPAIAIRLAKSSINRMLGGEEIVYACDAMPSLFATEDTQEGIRAFLDKRKPVFKDR